MSTIKKTTKSEARRLRKYTIIRWFEDRGFNWDDQGSLVDFFHNDNPDLCGWMRPSGGDAEVFLDNHVDRDQPGWVDEMNADLKAMVDNFNAAYEL